MEEQCQSCGVLTPIEQLSGDGECVLCDVRFFDSADIDNFGV